MLVCPISGSSSWQPLCRQGDHEWIRFPESGFVCLKTMPDMAASTAIQSEEVGDAYIGDYRRKLKSKARRSRQRARYLRRHMRGRRVLDVGSNVGIFVNEARKCGLEPDGVEISSRLCAHARETYPDIRFFCSPIEEFTAPTLYDGIYCSEVIEHSPDVSTFATALYGLLKPGGALYLTTPSIDEYMTRGEVVRDLGAPDHKLYFNRRNIDAFLHGIGFSRIRHKLALGRGLQLIAVK